MSILLIQK